MIRPQRKTLCMQYCCRAARTYHGWYLLSFFFFSLFSTDLIFETKACGVTDNLFSYQHITLPCDDSKWEIILKCREPGEGEDHANKPCWRASGNRDLWLKGASEQDKLVEAAGEVND